MSTSGRGTGMVGYNVQTAVETAHHLIVAHDVTQEGHDRHQLHRMAVQAREAIGTDALEVVADRGYFKGEEILACDQDHITTYLQDRYHPLAPRRVYSTNVISAIIRKMTNTHAQRANGLSGVLPRRRRVR